MDCRSNGSGQQGGAPCKGRLPRYGTQSQRRRSARLRAPLEVGSIRPRLAFLTALSSLATKVPLLFITPILWTRNGRAHSNATDLWAPRAVLPISAWEPWMQGISAGTGPHSVRLSPVHRANPRVNQLAGPCCWLVSADRGGHCPCPPRWPSRDPPVETRLRHTVPCGPRVARSSGLEHGSCPRLELRPLGPLVRSTYPIEVRGQPRRIS